MDELVAGALLPENGGISEVDNLDGTMAAGGDFNVRIDDESFPHCIRALLLMRPPKTPTPSQNFHLACYLLERGYTMDECKRVFMSIFQEKYDEDTADVHLKLIKLKECKPYQCFIVKHGLGLCNPDCERYRN